MKKYLLIREQSGGCDYTIGCGVAYSIFEAENIEAAIKVAGGNLTLEDFKPDDEDEDEDEDSLHDRLHDDFNLVLDFQAKNEHGINSATLYEINSCCHLDGPLMVSKKSLKEYQDSLSVKKQEQAERELYEKLKKKFDRRKK